MNLRKLEVFDAVVEAGSFSGAADRLYLSQSAVSQHIQDLEASLGTELFNRGRRGVNLTSAGETLADYSQAIMKLLQEAKSAITNVENIAGGQLRIGATPGVGSYMLPEWIQPFQERHPHLKFSAVTDVTSTILDLTEQRRLDISFVEGEMEFKVDLEQCILMETPQHVVVSADHPLASEDTISIHDLATEKFITCHPESHTRRWLAQIEQQYDIKLNVVAEFDNIEGIKQGVINNMGITLLPNYVIAPEMKYGMVKTLTVHDALLLRTLKLVWNRHVPFSPATKAFLTLLTNRFPNLTRIVTAQS